MLSANHLSAFAVVKTPHIQGTSVIFPLSLIAFITPCSGLQWRKGKAREM